MNIKVIWSHRLIKVIVIAYGIVLLTMVILAAVNYPTQWRRQTNAERGRYLEVLAQAWKYYYLDHDGIWPEMPDGTYAVSNTSDCQLECPALGQKLSCYNVQRVLVPSYVAQIPRDPFINSNVESGFYISRQGDDFTFGACYTFYKQKVVRPVAPRPE